MFRFRNHEQDGLLVGGLPGLFAGDDQLDRDYQVGDGQLGGNPVFFLYELQPLLCHAQAVWGLSFWCGGEHDQSDVVQLGPGRSPSPSFGPKQNTKLTFNHPPTTTTHHRKLLRQFQAR